MDDKQNLKESIADMIGSWAKKYAPNVSSGNKISQPSQTDQTTQQAQTKQNVPSNQSAATTASKQAAGTSAQKGGGRVQPKAGIIDARRATYGKLMLALKAAGVTEETKQKQYAEELLTNIIIPYLAANLNARGINITDARNKQSSVSKNPIKDASGNPKVITIAEAKASDRKINNPQVVRKTAESERRRALRRQRDEERKAKKTNQGSTQPVSTPTSDQPKARRKAPPVPEKYIKLAQEEEQASSASSDQGSTQTQITGETGGEQRRKTVPVNRQQKSATATAQSGQSTQQPTTSTYFIDINKLLNGYSMIGINDNDEKQFVIGRQVAGRMIDPYVFAKKDFSSMIELLKKFLQDKNNVGFVPNLTKSFQIPKDFENYKLDLNVLQNVANALFNQTQPQAGASTISPPTTTSSITAGTSTTPSSTSALTPSGTAPQRKKSSEITPYEKMLGLNIDPNKPIELFKGDRSLLQRINVFLRQKGVQVSAQGFQDQMLQIIKDIVAQLKVNGITNQQIQEHFDLTQELINESLVIRWKTLANIK